ncbi:MAG: Zn-dependent hydrolase, partial [Alphaproteobacteria bacterium]|nr:Zn-dependent hydrolase [Alphaproteobacteria bacterium]
RAGIYADYKLTSDLSHLSQNQKKMLGLLIDASGIMNNLFWRQAYGNKQKLLSALSSDKDALAFVKKNYGPWDRLNGDKLFLKGVKAKPLGANFYPVDMTRQEFAAFDNPKKIGLYSVIRRDRNGKLTVIPYHEIYRAELTKAATILKKAAKLADNRKFSHYLDMRANALISDNYRPSDFAWMDMKNNPIELVIGPIETYEDLLYGYRASYEAYVLIKDPVWSKKLARFISFLPQLQKGLPVA